MRRKIAFYLTLATTVLLIVLRFAEPSLSALAVGPFSVEDFQLMLCLLTVVAITVLCYSKSAVVVHPDERPLGTVNGWLCTFCGAVVTMSAAMDIFCWICYNQVPPPATYIYNRIDLVTSVASLLFGLLGGVYLVMQGFSWMSQSDKNRTARNWLALTPVLWMWFRLARYEISYASTIDIRESFFDFAVLVFASLFFLQMARMISGVGAAPKNALVVFALCTAMVAVSDAPVAILEASEGMPIGNLLIAMADLVIGIFAFVLAALQVFGTAASAEEPDDTVADESPEIPEEADDAAEEDNGMAWTEPARDLPPLEPAFDIHGKLPVVETPVEEAPVETPTEAAKAPTDTTDESTPLTVDDLLDEIDSF